MTSITRYDPFREALSLRNAVDQLFAQSFVNPYWMNGQQSTVTPMDVCETANGYEVNVSLPGVKPEDIELTVQQNTLTVKGHYSYQNQHDTKHPEQRQPQQQGQHQNWLMREIGTGSFERTITFPRPIDADHIQTNYENGLLSIMVPVSEASRPRRINVSSGQSQPKQVTVEAGR